jgi:uncharacterized RDD family membrane protein YckC
VELEDRVTFEGAEGLDLDVTLAGLGSRAAALFIDQVVQFLVVAVGALVTDPFGDAGVAVFALISFFALFGYQIVGEAFVGGRTLGKAAMGIAVVSDRGTPASFLAVVIRNVVRFVDLLPGVYLVGSVAILVTRRHQRLGDLAAGTLVISRPRMKGALAGTVAPGGGFADGSGWVGPGGAGAASFDGSMFDGWDVAAVTAEEVAALRSFLARRHQLTPEHRANLAQTLSFQILPKVAGVPLEGGPETFIERIVAAKTTR